MLGDFKKDDFTAEEKAALGEGGEKNNQDEGGAGKSQADLDAEATAKTDAEAADKAKAEAEAKAKTEVENKPDPDVQAVMDEEGVTLVKDEKTGKQYFVDKDGEKIPVERFKKIYAKAKESTREKEATENKLNLFKHLGAEEYYRLYPDEKPADWKPPAKEKTDTTETTDDFNAMVVTGGKYDGKTIGEVAQEDPVAASVMVNNYLESKRAAIAEESRKQEEFQQNFIAEKNSFCLSRAKELFNKDKDFTVDEINQVNGVYQQLADWMVKNKIAHYRMEDAYFLMNKDKVIQAERIKASKAAIEEATKKGVGAIGAGNGNAGLTGFEAYLAMTEKQLESTIDKMSDKDLRKFYKDAPKALREKHPGIPWD